MENSTLKQINKGLTALFLYINTWAGEPNYQYHMTALRTLRGGKLDKAWLNSLTYEAHSPLDHCVPNDTK